MRKIIDTANELGCSFSWIPHWANQVADQLAKQGAKHLASFVGDFLPPWLSNVFFCYTSLKDCLYFLYLSIDWRMKMFVSNKKKEEKLFLLLVLFQWSSHLYMDLHFGWNLHNWTIGLCRLWWVSLHAVLVRDWWRFGSWFSSYMEVPLEGILITTG